MKSISIMGAIALMCSGLLSANEAEMKNGIAFSSETLNLTELLLYIQDTVGLVIEADDETSQVAYHELKEALRIIYILNCLHQEEASTILQVLDECYADLADAMDKDPDKANILEHALLLFASGRNYEHETLRAQSLQDWEGVTTSNELKSIIQTTHPDLVYIQTMSYGTSERRSACNAPASLLYNASASLNSKPKILIIKHKSGDSSEYRLQGGVEMKLGGEDHGKISVSCEGEVKDKKSNYARVKVSKEKGYDCILNAGVKKEKK